MHYKVYAAALVLILMEVLPVQGQITGGVMGVRGAEMS